MNILKIIALISCFIAAEYMTAQVNFTEGASWENAKELSAKAGKPIFIDFYTTWCGPCKMMDKTTFQNATISKLMNSNFINLKVDAENPMYKELVAQFEINAYPTYIFAKSNGELIAKETGYKPAEDFDEICNKLFDFLRDDPISKLSSDKVEDLSDEEIESILTEYSNYNFALKESLKKNAYNKLKNDSLITLSEYKFLLSSYKPDDPYHLLLADTPEKLTMMNIPSWDKKFRVLFKKLYSNAAANNNEEQFNEIIKNYLVASEGPLSSLMYFKNPSKEIRTQRLTFYEAIEDYTRYFHVADTLINKYIVPANPEDIQRRDKYMSKIMKSALKSEKIMNDTKVVPRDSISIKHPNGSMFTHRLNDISENIVHNFNEKEYLSKAQEWVDLSITFIDLPESHLIKAAIFKKEGQNEKSLSEIEIARSSIYFDEKCTDLLEKFGL